MNACFPQPERVISNPGKCLIFSWLYLESSFPLFFFFFFSIPHPFLIMTIIFFSISIIYRPTPLEAKPTLAFSHHK